MKGFGGHDKLEDWKKGNEEIADSTNAFDGWRTHARHDGHVRQSHNTSVLYTTVVHGRWLNFWSKAAI